MNKKTVGFWIIFIPNIILLYASLYLAIFLRYPHGLENSAWHNHLKAFSIIYVFWLLVLFIHGLFEISSLRRYTGLFINLVSATIVNFLVSVVYFYFQPNLILTPRRFLLINLAISFALILVWDLLVKYFIKNNLQEKIYLFSFSDELKELEKEILNHSYLGFNLMGHLNEQTLGQAKFNKDIALILPDNLQAKPDILEKFYQLRILGVKFYNYKRFYENLLRRIYLTQINELWFLENINYQEKRFYNLGKRTVDLILGILGFAGFLVSFPFCALLVRLGSRGPIFFTQERVGKNGNIFKVYKYRTMAGGPTNTWTSINDPRITKTGRFLRQSRLDELPQFINLLAGNMSLVGPRPEQPHLVESLKKQIPFYDERHLVKPGITGWAQLNIYAGSLEETKLKLQYDLYYIKHRGFLFDLEIILKTIYYIFTWQGR